MVIDDRTVRWREGEAFVFDDTYEHEVWNDSDEEKNERAWEERFERALAGG